MARTNFWKSLANMVGCGVTSDTVKAHYWSKGFQRNHLGNTNYDPVALSEAQQIVVVDAMQRTTAEGKLVYGRSGQRYARMTRDGVLGDPADADEKDLGQCWSKAKEKKNYSKNKVLRAYAKLLRDGGGSEAERVAYL